MPDPTKRQLAQLMRRVMQLEQRVANMPVRPALNRGGSGINRFRARISNNSSIGTNRWSYSVIEVRPDLEGKFKDVPDGRTGTAYNTFEANNGSTGVQGSGDDQADLDVAGVSLKPIGPAVVWIDVDLDCNDNEIWFFEAPNNPGGQCAS